jgi:dihydroorotate dehydrogenase electron transfer subunit
LPGQFVHVRCGHFPLRRPFSVYRCTDRAWAILYRVHGEGTRWLATLEPGAMLDILGPLGLQFSSPLEGDRLMLVGGGVGVAPLACYAEHHADRLEARVRMGFRSSSDVSGLTPFHEAGFETHLFTEDGSLGTRGRVTHELARDLVLHGITRILTCGPTPMMAAVAAIAHELDLPCEASLERPMACGIGICLACVVPTTDGGYRRSCCEGPVIDAREVVW